MNTEEVTHVTIYSCQRCELKHDMLEFKPLSNPVDEWTYYALCPATNQPLLMKVV